jgi:SNF2 family DNA or RNA helicase
MIPDSQDYFCSKYIVLGKDDRVIGYRDLKGLAELVSPFVFRCNLADVVSLPALHFKEVRYSASGEVRQDSGRIEDALNEILSKEKVDPFELYKFYAEYKKLINNDIQRIKATVELVNGLSGQVIVASRFLKPIDFVAEGLNKSFKVVNGATKQKDRLAAVADFEAGKFDVLICSEILSTGFNLQYCHQLVFANTDFNYKNREQMIGRIQRIGQEKEMVVYDVLTFDETSMDNRIMKNLNIKKDLIKGLNNGFGEL